MRESTTAQNSAPWQLLLIGAIACLCGNIFAKESGSVINSDPAKLCETALEFRLNFDFPSELILTDDFKVYWRGHEVELQGNRTQHLSYNMIKVLVSNSDRMLTIDEFAQEVWPGDRYLDLAWLENNIAVQLLKIRKAFLAVDPNFEAIKQPINSHIIWSTGKLNYQRHGNHLEIDRNFLSVRWKDKPLNIRYREARLIEFLARNENTYVTQKQLYEAYVGIEKILRSDEKSDNQIAAILHTKVKEIRAAFRASDGNFDRIQTIPRIYEKSGYYWVGD